MSEACSPKSEASVSLPVRNALISVSDKQGLADLAGVLRRAGANIYSTGGTRKHLEGLGANVLDIAAYTGFPEMMDGRLKTLHPKVFGGLLCRRDRADDMQALQPHGIVPFELVVVNLYPFSQTIAQPGVTPAEAIEQIDIGGPSLVRAAAKNHAFTAVATRPAQYGELGEAIATTGGVPLDLRRRLAAEAFAHTAAYDQAIAAYFAREVFDDELPPMLTLPLRRRAALRYGENPHQAAAVYELSGHRGPSVVTARVLGGKELSYNNLLDLDSALSMVRRVSGPTAVVIKHNNPCGAATAEEVAVAAQRALDGDPVSAFGSVIGINRVLDAATAEVLTTPDRFIEAIVAPAYDLPAVEILTTRPKWKASVRLLEVGSLEVGSLAGGNQELNCRSIAGGMLVQQSDMAADDESSWKVATTRRPAEELWADLRFAWSMVRHVKSNAIVLASQRALVGIGAGQMSRVDSVQIAIRKAGDRAKGAVMASDAFFPFADSIHEAAAAGVAAIIQPGGSRRDDEVIAACDQHGLPMIFTSRRHFRH
jgi:phosphoribosylaminoimidazolecarboxamide formyltransferase/IMP cyclohydrolase